MRVGDGRVVPLTDSLSPNLSPAWSPDGRWVYYVSSRYGPRDIFAQAMAGGEPRGPALRLTTGLNAHTISLSADGRRIAYADLAIESNAWSIAVPAHPPAPATSAVQVTHGSQFVESTQLSRDGRWLYYDSDLSGNMDLYRMALPAGAPERLTTDSSDDFWPAPSPDGREVAFHSWRGGSRDIWVMPLDGGPLQRVTSSPAQEAMAVLGARRESPRLLHLRRSRRDLDGAPRAERRRLGRSRSSGWAGGSSLPGRPTGAPWRSAAHSPAARSGSCRPTRARPGSSPTPPGPRAVWGDAARWSDDGRAIYTRDADSTGTSFWRIPLGGGPPERLVAFEGGQRSSGGWGAAAGRLAYTRSDERSDVWVMEVRTR